MYLDIADHGSPACSQKQTRRGLMLRLIRLESRKASLGAETHLRLVGISRDTNTAQLLF